MRHKGQRSSHRQKLEDPQSISEQGLPPPKNFRKASSETHGEVIEDGGQYPITSGEVCLY